MRIALIITVLSAASCAGRLPPPSSPAPESGWIDIGRVRTESALGKRITDDDRVFVGSRNDELTKMGQQLQAAEKAKDKQLDTMRATFAQKQAQFQAEAQQRDQQDAARLVAAVQPIATALGTERHLSRVDFENHLWARGDLTDEVVRRLNAADGQGMAEELARTRAELAAAKAGPPKK